MPSTRTIEAQPIPNRYARGWHCLGLTSEFGDGKPHTVNAFGSRLVAYRGDDSKFYVLDAHCPHMGADLSCGVVRDNSLICPFHNWSWGGDGVCNAIPYSKVIPPTARVRSWPTAEQNRLLFVWHDPAGKLPTSDLDIPRIDACFSDDWNDWVVEKWTINTNCRELIDNVSDMAHFISVHGVPVEYFANVFEGHKATQVMLGKSSQLAMEGGLLTYATYYGPAYQITEMKGEMGGFTIDSILLNCHVPISLNSFDLRFGMLVRKIPGLSNEQNMEMAQTYIKFTQQGFYQDVAIWDNKVRIDNPLLCEGDGPIYHLRRWYQQFYQDEPEIPAAAREHRIFELNVGGLSTAPPLHHVFER